MQQTMKDSISNAKAIKCTSQTGEKFCKKTRRALCIFTFQLQKAEPQWQLHSDSLTVTKKYRRKIACHSNYESWWTP